jgi:rRNA-processing protein FCF1
MPYEDTEIVTVSKWLLRAASLDAIVAAGEAKLRRRAAEKGVTVTSIKRERLDKNFKQRSNGIYLKLKLSGRLL